MVINPVYDGAFQFYDGLANVGIMSGKDMKWGYINEQGETVINTQYSYPSNFYGGLAKVRIGSFKSGVEGYIDQKGNFVWKAE